MRMGLSGLCLVERIGRTSMSCVYCGGEHSRWAMDCFIADTRHLSFSNFRTRRAYVTENLVEQLAKEHALSLYPDALFISEKEYEYYSTL